jgi:DNA-directed RNA polymerase subunit N (RpoN/RPB10)
VFADQEGCFSCGNAIISDLNKFICLDSIEEKSNMIIEHDIKKEYIRSLVIEQIINYLSMERYMKIKSMR